jgi:hypothetical protein
MARRSFRVPVHTALALLTAAAAVIAAGEGFVAVSTANRANDVAAEANTIARARDLPQPYVILYSEAMSRGSEYGQMCLMASGDTKIWLSDFSLIVDVSNPGSVGVALSSIQEYAAQVPVPTGLNGLIVIRADARLFSTRERLNEWVDSVDWFDGTLGAKIDTTGVSFPAMPVELAPGSTVRLAVQGTVAWAFHDSLDPVALAAQAKAIGGSPTSLVFAFSSSETLSLDIHLPYPYQDDTPEAGATFTPCPNALPSGAWSEPGF